MANAVSILERKVSQTISLPTGLILEMEKYRSKTGESLSSVAQKLLSEFVKKQRKAASNGNDGRENKVTEAKHKG